MTLPLTIGVPSAPFTKNEAPHNWRSAVGRPTGRSSRAILDPRLEKTGLQGSKLAALHRACQLAGRLRETARRARGDFLRGTGPSGKRSTIKRFRENLILAAARVVASHQAHRYASAASGIVSSAKWTTSDGGEDRLFSTWSWYKPAPRQRILFDFCTWRRGAVFFGSCLGSSCADRRRAPFRETLAQRRARPQSARFLASALRSVFSSGCSREIERRGPACDGESYTYLRFAEAFRALAQPHCALERWCAPTKRPRSVAAISGLVWRGSTTAGKDQLARASAARPEDQRAAQKQWHA